MQYKFVVCAFYKQNIYIESLMVPLENFRYIIFYFPFIFPFAN